MFEHGSQAALHVAMPAGGGKRRLLREVKIESRDPAGLVRSAAKAVRVLQDKDKSSPRIHDVAPPEVLAVPVYGRPGRTVRLEFSVWDDSGRSREEVRVYGGLGRTTYVARFRLK